MRRNKVIEALETEQLKELPEFFRGIAQRLEIVLEWQLGALNRTTNVNLFHRVQQIFDARMILVSGTINLLSFLLFIRSPDAFNSEHGWHKSFGVPERNS